ncbi:MAG: radical SAM protein [Methanoregula sp.]|jgi:7-carboxy-7-deazaguanine synthase|uniref:7-carboxy-7-deazaguanine synthase QueE n=1 Tax=Methanoregula sp. TaxID=2052170 RepID=UPI0025EEBB16|nr:radical SAM protein [Methanoregula sp.]MCK9631107.1 radical SAM protein [Methanoregula sp.]
MKIAEIFLSLQGEGKNQGKPCLFIRLAGCNLNCTWCDTTYARDGVTMSLDSVLEQVWRINPPYVCITGGEPLIQADALEPLLASLHKRGTAIDIETNGTIDFSCLQQYASVCMDVKCPSSGEQSDLALLEKIRPQDSVKFVVNDETDCQYAQEVMNTHRIAGEIFFSPVFGTDYTKITNFILVNNLPIRFQIQLHKLIGVK